MKRTFAAVVLLAALGVLFKLAFKAPTSMLGDRPGDGTDVAHAAKSNPEADLLAKYASSKDRDLVARTLDRYHHTALEIERTDGLRGLALLDRLDIEAIYLYEKYPNDFRRLR